MDIVSRLAGVIGSENVSYCDSELQSYGVDRTTIWEGNPKAVVFPRSVKQLQDIILFANKYSLKSYPLEDALDYVEAQLQIILNWWFPWIK